MIGGFIITGNNPKRVIVRDLGPSLQARHVSQPLLDPMLELHGSDGALIVTNDNWRDLQETAIENSTLAPTDDLEAAIIATLQPGAYTAIVSGKNSSSGTALVEVYDLDAQPAASRLGNLSTRGFVNVGDGVMIGGFILGGGTANADIVVRGLGPSITASGVSDVLADPTLELRDGNGALLIENDNWADDPISAAQLISHNLAPKDSRESGIFTSLPPGNFTAIVAGKNGTTGLGLVEIYNIP
jgi:hypothetical protein